MDKDSVEALELCLFLNTVNQYYGYDLTQYRSSLIKRRIKDLVRKNNLTYTSELIPLIFYKQGFYEELMNQVSIGVSDFFRDPDIYKILSEQITTQFPNLQQINIWCAGCASGEEAYSLAILFKELNLLDKTHITATDLCNKAIESAIKGIYSTEKMQQYSANYQHAGGLTSLNYYFTSRYEWIKITDEIMQYISFHQHDLLTDGALNKKHLIACRNVLIYFSDSTQELVFKLLSKSLVKHGFLLLGPQDNLHSPTLASDFEVINKKAQLYRKK